VKGGHLDGAPAAATEAPVPELSVAAGRLVDLEGERFYEISAVDAMPPFLITVTSDRDHWMFVSSAGALTAGRRDPDHALFPYTTDDRIHDSGEVVGPKTIVRVRGGRGHSSWEPFSVRHEGRYRTARNLYKSVSGNKLRFEEVNRDLGLTFAYVWMNSARFGFVRRATLRNDGATPVEVDLLDGVLNVLPAGIGRRFQLEYSTLADGYKDSELDPATGLGIFRLASIPVDAAEPSEALRATTVWSAGLEGATPLLSSAQLPRFRRGQGVERELRVRGQRGAYLVAASLPLGGGKQRDWLLVADVAQDAAAVVATQRLLRGGGAIAEVEADVARGTRNLLRIVARTDGLQVSADELDGVRHFANVMFNDMRGGVPEGGGYLIGRDDLGRVIATANKRVHARHAAFLAALPQAIRRDHLLAAVRAEGDPHLERLAFEYLPLGFSRRHGDPSRPWNVFSVVLEDEAGNRVLDYQGNWRDIFQNWEALALSYPEYVESMIFKFVDASTADGYNPYRLTRDGFEWEVHDPHEPWSYIGYWGDHQVIYLQKLLELSARYHPGALAGLLDRPVFTYANVPYRIKPHEAQLANPQQTIDFDEASHRAAAERVAALGTEGKKLLDAAGDPYRATLAEKLLVMTLAKLATFVPGAGLWLNTQRPEWNDANNALVGHGASIVTLCHLRRFLSFARSLFGGGAAVAFSISEEVKIAFDRIGAALRAHEPLLAGPLGDADRRVVLDAVAIPWSEYRARLYERGLSGVRGTVTARELEAFCELALRQVDHSLAANRREDGLYHAYNLIKIGRGGIAIRRLYEMLEGQVAVLGSGALSPQAALAVLEALRASALYRADQHSYLLYPDRRLPAFLEKNRLPEEAVRGSRVLSTALERGDRRLVVRDADGHVHWNADFRNAGVLARALDALGREESDERAAAAATERRQLLELYERVFDHQSFTGRSGTFYKYEGLGCIYWHMVSKLLLAVHEVLEAAGRGGAPAAVMSRLREHYQQIRDGIGVHKSPAVYGAFPIDPYSHTPSFTGAQQPGMTGQVKEDIITRQGELGVVVEGGRITFRPDLVRTREFLTRRTIFHYLDVLAEEGEVELGPGSLAFTICQVPVVARRSGPARVVITPAAGSVRTSDGLELDPETSAQVFQRTGVIQRLEVFLALDD
jgi:hypothetical protein